MGFLSKLKAVLGLSDTGRRSEGGTSVAVEREPDAASERAVKEGGPREGPGAEEAAGDDTAGEADAAADSAGETDAAEVDSAGETDAAADSAGETDATGEAEEETEAGGEAEADDAVPDIEGGDDPVESVKGIGPAYGERLGDAGVETVAELAAADAEELEAATGISASRIETWIERAGGG